MKKILFAFLIVFCIQNCMAQSAPLIGLRAGLNISDVVGRDVKGLGAKFGYHAGVYFRFKMNSPGWSFQPELLLNVKGYEVMANPGGYINYQKSTLYYIDVPLLFNYNATDNHSLSFGAMPGVFIGDRQRERYNGAISIYSGTGVYNPIDVALVVGYTYEADNGLNAGFRMSYGLPYVDRNVLGTGFNHSHNFNTMFTVGYTIGK